METKYIKIYCRRKVKRLFRKNLLYPIRMKVKMEDNSTFSNLCYIAGFMEHDTIDALPEKYEVILIGWGKEKLPPIKILDSVIFGGLDFKFYIHFPNKESLTKFKLKV